MIGQTEVVANWAIEIVSDRADVLSKTITQYTVCFPYINFFTSTADHRIDKVFCNTRESTLDSKTVVRALDFV